ncbi:exodeoxyribonuclease V subunit gamma [Gordonia rhizosphera]|uniref:RecBCD enzyme subunit RecC n=1 Tax=Gordonia rhizosphera NBRC 16068 TaxID=1108045 RepID=K6V384_9ACTN|nr:exodeoxyribonuclease V subunit gamma [Gordonia rhizosphera]GAB90518.1 exodeoxyribonuclease V gamma chain [Gordonia rhizosphera NBRC 16068]
MFHLHRAERTDALADALADLLSSPPSDPLSPEVVAVPAPGVERWLQQRLATRLGASGGGDGIAANIDFTSPAALTDRVIGDVRGAASGADRWRGPAMTWPVLMVLDETIDDPGLAVLARHVGADTEADDHRRGRRFATARQIAELFDGYGRQRPAMLSDWAAGHDTDGAGRSVPDDLGWQPAFWRAVRESIGEPHPAEDLPRVCARLRDDPTSTDLPERLSVFGPTRVTESLLAVLAALAVHREVHLFVPHPGPALWDAVTAAAPTTPTMRRAELTPPRLTHPLLSSLSRDVTELQLRVAPVVDRVVHHPPVSAVAEGGSVLAALQAGIRDDRLEVGSVPADNSVEIHSCHGRERQVEVLRDRLLHLFADDPSLQPRDVVVMCPDVESFAPLIRGAFGQPGLGHPAFELRVRLADRGLRTTNEVLDVVATVVELAAGRVTAGEVLDLLGRAPVRQRFDVSDDDLDMIREWLAGSNVRWGIADGQRARFGLAGFGQGTFAAGLDRIVLGAVAEEADGEWLDTALPLAGVESTEIDLAGRFAEFVARLSEILDSLSGTHPLQRWIEILVGVIDALVLTGRDEEWQRAQAIRALTAAFDGHRDGGDTEERIRLRLGDIRDLVAVLVAAAPTRANFRTGELTVCSMVPMRSVPHRVIVLLGVDADAFPRAQRTDGDDILGREPLVGERNPRDEDRQLFLDAICAARDNLLVFYSGSDPVSGERIPPAVVVSELVDTVTALTGPDGADRGCVRLHTLHGFDAANFRPGTITGIDGPLSFDRALLAGARSLGRAATATPPIADIAIPPAPDDDIDLDDLVSFLLNPIEGFVRQRLGARVPDDERPHADQLDVELDALERWGIGDRFLNRMLAGEDLARCQAAELRRGTLPPFTFGTRELQAISTDVTAVFDAAAAARAGRPRTADLTVALPDGRRLYGTVGDIFGGTVVTATYSKLRAKQRLGTWVRLVALAAARGGEPDGAEVLGGLVVARRPGRRGGVARSLYAIPDDPLSVLTDLVALRDAGLRRVLPLPIDPAAEFVAHHRRGGPVATSLPAARRSFDGDFGAGRDRYLRLVFGGDVTADVDADAMFGETLPDDGRWCGLQLPGDPGDPLFAGLARLVWEPLIEHETTT